MEYFIIINHGYDGLTIERVGKDKEQAEALFDVTLKEEKAYHKRYPNIPQNKGLILIEGTVIKEDNKDEIL